MRSAPSVLTLPEAADRLGVHYMTAYRYVRQGRLPATRVGTQWEVRLSDLEAMTRKGAHKERRGARRIAADVEGMQRRIMADDVAGAWWLVESHLGGGMDASGVLTDLMVPALHSIGDRWANGEISVADEHRATSACQRVIGRLGFQFAPSGKSRGTVALAAPAGDLHALPISIVADLLRWRGMHVLELGANTPASAVGEAVASEGRLVAVGIAVTTPGLNAAMDECIAAVHAARPEVPVFVGGAAVTSERQAKRLGADEWSGLGARAAVDTVERLVSANPLPKRNVD
jgi:MerR family transcriptional regulator, light-induced transcriptional regulator